MHRQTDSRLVAQSQPRFTTAEVRRLSGSARTTLATHFLDLPADDRRLRFGASLSAEAVTAYVEGLDFDRDAVYALFDDELAAVGVAHVAFGEHAAELGISVLPHCRGRGVGTALFARAAEHARNRRVGSVFMHCLAENAAIMHIARKSGMDIVAAAGDADARLALSPASVASIAGELLADRLALYDYALKAHVATWKGIKAAFDAA